MSDGCKNVHKLNHNMSKNQRQHDKHNMNYKYGSNGNEWFKELKIKMNDDMSLGKGKLVECKPNLKCFQVRRFYNFLGDVVI